MKTSLRRALPAALALGLAVAGSAQSDDNRYVSLIDPRDPVPESGVPIEWRGDQLHPRPVADAPDEGPWVFHVDDFRWTFRTPTETRSKWWPLFLRARIDVRKVKAIHVLWSPFRPEFLAGHTAMYLEMEPGGLTRLSDGGAGGELPGDGGGVVLSVEARMKVFTDEAGNKTTEKYGFVDGLRGKFPTVYSLSTYANYQQRCLDVYQGELHHWKLTLSEHEARTTAQVMMEETLANHRGETYWLTRRSCSTEFMDILIRGLERSEATGGSGDRSDEIAGLKLSLDATRAADMDTVENDGKSLVRQIWDARKWLNPKRLIGMTRDNVVRRSWFGIFVNPLMSFPAQLPGVLHRRGLLEDSEADQIQRYGKETEVQEEPGYGGLLK